MDGRDDGNEHRGVEAHFLARRPSSACCTSISPAASPSRGAICRTHRACREVGLYTNLITSGVGLTRDLFDRSRRRRARPCAACRSRARTRRKGRLDRRLQGRLREKARGRRPGWPRRACRSPSTPSSIAPMSSTPPRMVDFAVELGARRIEIAHTQYYGWALHNRAHLMPTREQTRKAPSPKSRSGASIIAGPIVIDHVAPDYHAKYPKACMSGWGRLTLNVTPQRQGPALPCGRDHSRPGILERARAAARRSLGAFPGLQRLSRRRLDAGALPLLRTQERWISAAAAARRWRCSATPPHRSRLHEIAASRDDRGDRRRRQRWPGRRLRAAALPARAGLDD